MITKFITDIQGAGAIKYLR